MDERTEAKLIYQAVHALGIDVPVMATRIVGDDPVGSYRVELYLYGGQVKVFEAPAPPAPAAASADPAPPETAGSSTAEADPAPPEAAGSSIADIADYNHPAVRDLEGMELVTLRDLARRRGIAGAAKLSKAKLIKALRESR